MKTFTESNLIFSFEEENWNIIQYDKDPKYLTISNALEGTKAIDFLGFYNKSVLVLFEVKGFRGYGSQKSRRFRAKTTKSLYSNTEYAVNNKLQQNYIALVCYRQSEL